MDRVEDVSEVKGLAEDEEEESLDGVEYLHKCLESCFWVGWGCGGFWLQHQHLRDSVVEWSETGEHVKYGILSVLFLPPKMDVVVLINGTRWAAVKGTGGKDFLSVAKGISQESETLVSGGYSSQGVASVSNVALKACLPGTGEWSCA